MLRPGQNVHELSHTEIILVYAFDKKNELVMREFNGDNPEHRNHFTITIRHPRGTIRESCPDRLFRGRDCCALAV
jgi:hypothetical protein